MQSAAKRKPSAAGKTPAVGKTPAAGKTPAVGKTPGTVGQTTGNINKSNRVRIDEVFGEFHKQTIFKSIDVLATIIYKETDQWSEGQYLSLF